LAGHVQQSRFSISIFSNIAISMPNALKPKCALQLLETLKDFILVKNIGRKATEVCSPKFYNAAIVNQPYAI
jgi:hypothetical protein